MKRVFLISGYIILLLIINSITFGYDTVRLTNGEWEPYTSKNLKHYGPFSHIVSEAFSLENIQAKYEFFPWTRGYKLGESGEFDGSIAWAPNKKHKKAFYFSEPVISSEKVFFHLKSFPFDWKTINDLKKYKIGGTLGYSYGETFDQAAQNNVIFVEYITRDIQNIQKVLAGRIDIFPMEINVGYELITKQLGANKASLVTHHQKPVFKTPFCMVISKKIEQQRAQRLISAFNRGLKKLKERGRYDQILESSREGKYKKPDQ